MKSLHRDGPVLSNIACLPDRRPTALVSYAHKRSIAVTVGAGFGIECLVRTDVANESGALVGESCKSQSLPNFHDLFAVYFVT